MNLLLHRYNQWILRVNYVLAVNFERAAAESDAGNPNQSAPNAQAVLIVPIAQAALSVPSHNQSLNPITV